jgi:hypothetical protein
MKTHMNSEAKFKVGGTPMFPRHMPIMVSPMKGAISSVDRFTKTLRELEPEYRLLASKNNPEDTNP